MQTAKVPGDVVAIGRAEGRWGPGRRLAFRFVFVYSLVYLFPFPIFYIPGLDAVSEAWEAILLRAAVPVGDALFGLKVINEPTGSGDTAFAFVAAFLTAAVALLAALLWSLVDRRRANDRVLLEILLVYVRFALATTLLSYGAVKVWKSQFPLPPPARLMEPLGAMSPMGLLWTFMGHSTAYTVFAGAVEMLGGALLFVRRTALLGALVTAGAMANVVMLNLSYDVPVKQYSMHLLGFALLVAAPHASRLFRFFVLGTAVPPDAPPGPPRLRAAGALVGLVVAGLLAFVTVQQARESYVKWGDGSPPGPLDGVYAVDELVAGGRVVPPTFEETERLRRVGFSKSVMSTLTAGDAFDRFNVEVDDTRTKLTVRERGGPKVTYALTLTPSGDGRLVLAGTLRGQELRATLRKLEGQFPLQSRGFRWVQEQPYNR